MIAKGITHHILPYAHGWAVYEELNPETFRFFNSQEEALNYAKIMAATNEAPLLIRECPPCHTDQPTLLMACDTPA